ncbi:hypothetical protein N7481_009159, partial [Penicillium waksmanii]|uniref:uncharacterized protein n=1 Tax=Penicillium waksmanii TaxID=69791 RepID=UPI002547626B
TRNHTTSESESESLYLSLDTLDTNDPLFHVCWRRQSCSYCLAGDVACSWCATSSACVPNAARLPILAPIRNAQICPLGSKERWELRTMPFGCNVSTLTFLSVVGTVVGLVGLVGMGVVGFCLVRSVRRRWKESDYERLDGRGFLDIGLLASVSGLIFGRRDERVSRASGVDGGGGGRGRGKGRRAG